MRLKGMGSGDGAERRGGGASEESRRSGRTLTQLSTDDDAVAAGWATLGHGVVRWSRGALTPDQGGADDAGRRRAHARAREPQGPGREGAGVLGARARVGSV